MAVLPFPPPQFALSDGGIFTFQIVFLFLFFLKYEIQLAHSQTSVSLTHEDREMHSGEDKFECRAKLL